ncbi:MAG: winged helix-turn-helix domain-containing protein [Candidatus Bipolaricaulota bacterium]|nr:winged helix-turn-helix domain-containing protein [Candidatus Bipolaricaulota bacterium]MCS7274889.1 winged helix-turn-helix domain-containing protein [Candidatus Bipolaricaulota bacterium]MDW8111168.1 winged helix-turn-helix domain-containing protein [Candidatus Bipolaricaulota bacterium]MDW8329922.1 winged helix-turn-helix domain-containing protein [Candidatus Bipolaricaulota bacterium]
MLSRGKFALWVTLIALVLMAPLAIVFAQRMSQELEREFLQRSELLANNFADQVRFRLQARASEDPAQLHRELQEMTNTFVMGLVLYAQVVWRGEVLAQDVATSVLPGDLLNQAPPPEPMTKHQRNGLEYLDIWRELEPEQSYVRLGVSLIYLRAAIWEALWPMIALGVGLVIAIGLGAYLVGPRWAKAREPGTASERSSPAATKAPEPIRLGKLTIDDQSKEIRLNGTTIPVTPREYALLYLLASEPGRVFSPQEIIARAWGDERFIATEDVKKYIYLLRQKLERDPQKPQWIVTVRGFGYKLQIPD